MANPEKEIETRMSLFQKFGLLVASVFFLVSVFYVHFMGPTKVEYEPGMTILNLAHWQMNTGFREGFEEMDREFEAIQAKKGRKVKIIQTTIPGRGYQQWLITQLVGGEPADVIENPYEGAIRDQYFTALSPYLGKPNPFNKGTPLEGIPWKDTFIDNMEGAFDVFYADYYGLGVAFFAQRLHVNVDLVEKATGSRKLPTDLVEWVETCQKIQEYGERIRKPIIPIGVEGLDRSTLNFLFVQYYSQTSGNLMDRDSRFCECFVWGADILQGIKNGTVNTDRLLAVVDILREIGQYFQPGFTTMGLEQTTYLFHQGQVAFLPGHSANSYSLIANSDFPVEIIPIPPIGARHKYSPFFTGRVTESGNKVEGLFGIPKATRHFDLALELLQFMTSWKINQETMASCNWAPAVKFAHYSGFMKAFEPYLGGNPVVWDPWRHVWDSRSHRKRNEIIEEIIQKNILHPQEYFLEEFRKYKHYMVEELGETLTEYQRANLMREMRRSQLTVGLWQPDLDDAERGRVTLRGELVREDYAERNMWNCMYALQRKVSESF
ncbi:MAG: extracellular solute-binding protein [Planctomycetota bacterium]